MGGQGPGRFWGRRPSAIAVVTNSRTDSCPAMTARERSTSRCSLAYSDENVCSQLDLGHSIHEKRCHVFMLVVLGCLQRGLAISICDLHAFCIFVDQQAHLTRANVPLASCCSQRFTRDAETAGAAGSLHSRNTDRAEMALRGRKHERGNTIRVSQVSPRPLR